MRAALRLAFRLGDRLAPGAAARVAGNIWFTPPRPRRAAPGRPGGEVWGDTGPRIYFMHGWGGQGADIAAAVPALLESGFRVVTFDAPARRRTNAIEFGRALAAMVAHHGPAHAVVAHSLGAVAVSLALRSGDLTCDRLVLLAPVVKARGQLAAFARHLGIGKRTLARLDHEILRHTGAPLDDFRLLGPDDRVNVRDVLVVHDRDDRMAPHEATAAHVRDWPAATLRSTGGLGHYRLLQDPAVHRAVAAHLTEVPAGRELRH